MEGRRQTSSLRQAHVRRKVLRTSKTVSSDSRDQKTGWIVGIKVFQSASRKISAWSNERVIACIVKRPAKIARRTRWTNKVLRTRCANTLTCVWRPWETGMSSHDSIDLPTIKYLAGRSFSSPEKWQVPKS